MAKRKAAGSRRKTAARRTGSARGASRRRAAAKKSRSRAKSARKRTVRKPVARARGASKKRLAKTSSTRKKAAARPAAKARPASRTAGTSRRPPASLKPREAASRPAPPKATSSRRASPPAVARKAPALSRARRTITDDDVVPTPPSTLDLDRSASAARSGRRELRERFDEHTETSPAITGGDVDADWESAYTVGDEAPGGDSPTPDQDIVDDIGRAVGVEYQDNEELKGDEKIARRDRHRWELDPASSEDYDDR